MIRYFVNLNPVLQSLIATIFTYLITTLGASLVFLIKKINKTLLDGMLGFSAGVMISASFLSLLSPAIEICNNLELTTWLVTFIGFILGGVFLFIGDKLYTKLDKNNNISKKRCTLLILSMTLHNIPEGMAIGVAFGSIIYNLDGATLLSACLLALGIGIQNLPEGSAVAIPLIREGYTKKKAFFYGQLSALVEPISGVIGALLVLKIRLLLPYLLCFASGAMIYVVVEELIPESQTNEKKDVMALFTLIGFSLMMILDIALG